VTQTDIPGYTYGTAAVDRSPVSLQDLELLKATLLLGDDDLAALRRSGAVLAPQVEEILDVWYGFVGANPHLLAAFSNAQGQPDQHYLAAVRRRFGNGSSIPPGPPTTRPGSTTSTRSACGTPAPRRTGPTGPTPPTTSRCAMFSPCWCRSPPP